MSDYRRIVRLLLFLRKSQELQNFLERESERAREIYTLSEFGKINERSSRKELEKRVRFIWA